MKSETIKLKEAGSRMEGIGSWGWEIDDGQRIQSLSEEGEMVFFSGIYYTE